jgi:hypothetical protein
MTKLGTLSSEQTAEFMEQGFVQLPGIVPHHVIAAGQQVIWSDLGMSPDDPSTWTEPVKRLIPSDPRPFAAAFDSQRLFAAFDQLVGEGRWLPRPDLGIFVVRFPSEPDLGDTGWHIDTSFPPENAPDPDFSNWRVSVSSRDRGLLMLFLFSNVTEDDAPTRIRIGSHLDVPLTLAAAGPNGMPGTEASPLVEHASSSRPVATATGESGDVYLCHPFLVHAAQRAKGVAPRLMAQPPLAVRAPFAVSSHDEFGSPVEICIRNGLSGNLPQT